MAVAKRCYMEVLYEDPLYDEAALGLWNCCLNALIVPAKTVPSSDEARFCAFGLLLTVKACIGIEPRMMGANYVPHKKERIYPAHRACDGTFLWGNRVCSLGIHPCGDRSGSRFGHDRNHLHLQECTQYSHHGLSGNYYYLFFFP